MKPLRFVVPIVLDVIPRFPGLTGLVDSFSMRLRDIDSWLTLQYLQGQTGRCMPCNVTVQKPRARIVGLESKDEIPVRRE